MKSSSSANLAGKTLFISGGSRGIGLSIALRAAKDGANVVVAAKTTEAHPKLEGTIYTATKEIEDAGGNALACKVDIREEAQVEEAVAATIDRFGGIDILVNNASAINLSNTEELPIRRYDLIQQINTRGTFLCSQKCIPHLKKAENPHILTLSPPLNFSEKWMKSFIGYTISKYGMTMCALGFAEEFKDNHIASNALWPKTTIATAAIKNFPGSEDVVKHSRTPEIMADAAYEILTRNSKSCTGNTFIDEDVLRDSGKTNFDHYRVMADVTEDQLALDLYVD